MTRRAPGAPVGGCSGWDRATRKQLHRGWDSSLDRDPAVALVRLSAGARLADGTLQVARLNDPPVGAGRAGDAEQLRRRMESFRGGEDLMEGTGNAVTDAKRPVVLPDLDRELVEAFTAL